MIVGLGGRKSATNQSKIDPEEDRKQDASWHGVWMVLRPIFDGFWLQVGSRVGAKSVPNSKEMGYQGDVKESSKK